jgi:hypothetical protein
MKSHTQIDPDIVIELIEICIKDGREFLIRDIIIKEFYKDYYVLPTLRIDSNTPLYHWDMEQIKDSSLCYYCSCKEVHIRMHDKIFSIINQEGIRL